MHLESRKLQSVLERVLQVAQVIKQHSEQLPQSCRSIICSFRDTVESHSQQHVFTTLTEMCESHKLWTTWSCQVNSPPTSLDFHQDWLLNSVQSDLKRYFTLKFLNCVGLDNCDHYFVAWSLAKCRGIKLLKMFYFLIHLRCNWPGFSYFFSCKTSFKFKTGC